MRTERKVALGLAAVGVAAVAGLVTHVASGAPVPQHTAVDVASQSPGSVVIQFAGDTMQADGAAGGIAEKGWDWPLDGVRDLLTGDYLIVNAEAPFTDLTQPADPTKQFTYNVPPAGLDALARAGVDAISLGNNHSMDRGLPGLTDTLVHAEDAGLQTLGAGMDLVEAAQPLLLRTGVGTVGIVSMVESPGTEMRATPTGPGVPAFSAEQARRSFLVARSAGADWVIAFMHWGENYQPLNDLQVATAEQLEAQGYAAVVGSGSHTTQPVRVIGAMPVVYSMGNFVFGAPGSYERFGAIGTGQVVSLRLGRDGEATLELRCIRTNNAVVDYQPQTCTRRQAVRALRGSDPALRIDRSGLATLPVRLPSPA